MADDDLWTICEISSQKVLISECYPYSAGWASRQVWTHQQKMRKQMLKRGLVMKMYQYREVCGYPAKGQNVLYKPPSNNEYRNMETFLMREEL